MPIFGRSRRGQNNQHPPTTAELRERRLREWEERFPGPASEDDYRRAFLKHSPLLWDIIQSTQHDLLRLLVNRVPAELGVPVIFSVTVIFGRHPKAEDAARAILATIVHDLRPAQARTLLVSLADAWHNAERSPYEQRGRIIAREFRQTLRRLQTTTAEDTGAVSLIDNLIAGRDTG